MPRYGQHRGRRALRLLAAIGATFGVLCLVLAAMGLVIELGPHNQTAAGRFVRAFHGYGTDPPKKIRLPRRYGITWSFSCPPGKPGTFSVDAASDGGPGQPKMTKHGRAGSGTLRRHWGQSARSLYIVSDCDWRARLIPPPESSPEPHPGGTHRHEHGKGQEKHKKHKKKAKKPRHAKKKHAKKKKHHKK